MNTDNTDYYASKYIDLPLPNYIPPTHLNVLQQIADENDTTIDESIAFIRTLSIEIVNKYRKQLLDRPTFGDEWITLPVTFPSGQENNDACTFRLLGLIFKFEIAGEQSFIDEQKNYDQRITSRSYDYVDEPVNRCRLSKWIKAALVTIFVLLILIVIGAVVFVLVRPSKVLENNACASNPCLNGGSCQSATNLTYSCDCTYDTTGTNCETPLVCNETSCATYATCLIAAHDTYCKCDAGFFGNPYCNFGRTNNQSLCYCESASTPSIHQRFIVDAKPIIAFLCLWGIVRRLD